MLLAPGTALLFILSLPAAALAPQEPAGAVAAHVASMTTSPTARAAHENAGAVEDGAVEDGAVEDDAPGPGSPVPEPGTLLLVGSGLICVTVTRRMRRRASVRLEEASSAF